MYLSLLVPLDRSSFAEQALPLAFSIARRAKARLELVEVHALYALDDPHCGWAPFEPDLDAERGRQEQLYLEATARWAASVSPVETTAAVFPGSATLPTTVADGLLERARAGKADLIVMATRGWGRLSDLGLGSVADELVRRSHLPVLLVRPSKQAPGMVPEPVVDNILVPLDGSSLAEQVLVPALELAHLMEARCILLRVVERRSSPGDGGSNGLSTTAPAETYLEHIAGRLRGQGLEVQTRVVVARGAAEAIRKEAGGQPNTLVALATHGRGGLKRLLLGSVADKVIRGVKSPVLVYRPPG